MFPASLVLIDGIRFASTAPTTTAAGGGGRPQLRLAPVLVRTPYTRHTTTRHEPSSVESGEYRRVEDLLDAPPRRRRALHVDDRTGVLGQPSAFVLGDRSRPDPGEVDENAAVLAAVRLRSDEDDRSERTVTAYLGDPLL